MRLVVTIDTEEDNWGGYSDDLFGVENIKKMLPLQKLFDKFNVIPTYLVTHPVATQTESFNILKEILQRGKCEIGMHCHPWSTPPFEEERNPYNSMLCNLPYDLQRKKMSILHEAITQHFGVVPISFRAGRWGFGVGIARILNQMGYKVDSSLLAFENWTDYGGPNCADVSPKAFIYGKQEGLQTNPQDQLLEVPATAGFAQQNWELCNRAWSLLGGKLMQKLHVRGILGRLRVLNKIWLSPETSSGSDMMRLTNTMMRQGYQIINMFFHSTALMAGFGPFVKTKEDEVQFLHRIEDFLAFTQRAGIESIRLSDAPTYVLKRV
jgi:hypothetical protein